MARRAVSSVGRATLLHSEGHRFESCTAHKVYMVTSNSFAVANEFSRPRLAVPQACGTSLRPAHNRKNQTQVWFLCVCALGWNRTNINALEERSSIH